MIKSLWTIFVFLTLSVSVAFTQPDDFAKTLQKKLNLYYSNNVPVNLHLFFNQPAYSPGDTAFFKASFFTAQENKFIGGRQVININLVTKEGKTVRHQKVLINDGWGYNQLIVPPDLDPGIYEIIAYSDWMKNHDPSLFYYSELIVAGEYVFKNEETKKFELYPEGGNFVSGVENKIVVTGSPFTEVRIVDGRKNIVAKCILDSLGLGYFMITPQLQEEYRASTGEMDKLLPSVLDSKVAMMIPSASVSGQIMNIVLQVSDSNRFSDGFYFVISSENKLHYSATLNFDSNKKRVDVTIPKDLLPSGIYMATLFRHDRSVEATRLFKVEKNPATHVVISTEKEFNVREKVTLKVQVDNEKGQPVKSRLGISVYAQDLFEPYDENPLKHFIYNHEQRSVASSANQLNRASLEQWDNFMITQSWKRFLWNDVWNEVRKNEHTFKANLHFTGKVVMDNMKPSDSTVINFFLNKDVRTYQGDIATDGSFDLSLFFDFEGDDEVFYMVEQNGKIRRDAKVIIDKDSDLQVKLTPFVKSNIPDRYGMFSVTRREIDAAYKVRSVDKIKTKSVNPHALLEDEVYGPDVSINLEDYLIMPSMEETLREIIPLIQHRWRNKKHTIRIHLLDPDVMTEEDPLYFIDGVLTDNTNYFMGLKPDDVVSIKVIVSQRKLNTFGLIGKNGIVLVETRIPDHASRIPKSPAIFNVRGLNGEISFEAQDSHGKDSERIPDLRSTLYWNPDVRTDENGFATLSFYTSDNAGKFKIVIDGTTANSENVFAEKTFDVRFAQEK